MEEPVMNTTRTSTFQPISLRTLFSASLLTLLALILLITPALAKAPSEGVVYEGKSVPGAALGETRGNVVRSYGEPLRCDDLSFGGISINRTYTCSFAVEGGGIVDVRFNRSYLSPVPVRYDKVTFIRWSQEVSGWKTTAGINTEIALEEPKAVVEAYPNASVRYNSIGEIIQVRDSRLGIQVDWLSTSDEQDYATKRVSMAIFPPAQITFSDF